MFFIYDIERDDKEVLNFHELLKFFWTEKLGYYPAKMEKVVREVTREERNKEKEQIDLEFEEFLKQHYK